MNGPRSKKARRRRSWCLAARFAGFPSKQGMRRTVANGGEATLRCAVDAGHECQQERRHLPNAETHAGARLVRPGEPGSGHPGVAGARIAGAHSAGLKARLQPLRMLALSAGLRPVEVGRCAGQLSDDRLHGRWGSACEPTHRVQAGDVAALSQGDCNGAPQGRENANASPAPGRSCSQTSRPGTNGEHESAEKGEFVPPRDKTPRSHVGERPAPGHLFRFAICMGAANLPCLSAGGARGASRHQPLRPAAEPKRPAPTTDSTPT